MKNLKKCKIYTRGTRKTEKDDTKYKTEVNIYVYNDYDFNQTYVRMIDFNQAPSICGVSKP